MGLNTPGAPAFTNAVVSIATQGVALVIMQESTSASVKPCVSDATLVKATRPV